MLVGAPEDRRLVDDLKDALGPIGCLDLCGQTSLPRLAAVASEVNVFLSNDTGPLHLAAATGTKVVGVYTCTSPARAGLVWLKCRDGQELRLVRPSSSRPAATRMHA